MTTPKHSDVFTSIHPYPLLSKSRPDTPTFQLRIRVGISRKYHQEPVICQLTYVHGLIVNITAAMLNPQTGGQGWFDLELRGTPQQIQSGLAYLEELDLQISGKSNSDGDGWHY